MGDKKTSAMKLLLHICCGPCASATVPFWTARKVEVVGFFFNPNIHPYLEFKRRLTAARDMAELTGLELLADESYDPVAWFQAVGGEAGEGKEGLLRCRRCIGLRLERVAREAAVQGCEAFSTTLAISPWQNHSAIEAEGRRVSQIYGPRFIYEDLRPLYAESRRLSHEWGLYRQKYCGCLVSEWERYRES